MTKPVKARGGHYSYFQTKCKKKKKERKRLQTHEKSINPAR